MSETVPSDRREMAFCRRRTRPATSGVELLRDILLFMFFVGLSYGAYMVEGTQYTVGGNSGWSLGVDYANWASSITFKTGDSLVFSYSDIHTVVQVDEADYSSCNSANAIATGTGGNSVFKLDKDQTYYFMCGVASHCAEGMKLAVTVTAASSSPSTGTVAPPTSKTPPSTINSPAPSSAVSLLPWEGSSILALVFTCLFYLISLLI
ncbi:hypothetical protein KP509_38G052700 [Ceratopteris richardii]|uniref:Phytocyanin domain-containing protein n=1 Tax=Ceratopteris richardii TaxID=49495 RepID=A0A8T2Q535_CERRI|nr:hypothetical protein KP509_38G052700 [Ceratopteris richardii]